MTLTSNTGGASSTSAVGSAPGVAECRASDLPRLSDQDRARPFTVRANPAGYAAGTYSASIAVAIGSQSGTLTVNMVVGGGGTGGGTTAVAPTSLTFTYQLGASAATIPLQKLVITGPAGNWSSAISTGATWLKFTPGGGSALPNPAISGDTPIVSVDPTGLPVGSYSGTINITTSGGTQPVQVSLTVVAGPTLVPNPGSLIFNAQTGQGNPSSQNVFFSGSDNTLNPISIVATSNTSWISLVAGQTGVVGSGGSGQYGYGSVHRFVLGQPERCSQQPPGGTGSAGGQRRRQRRSGTGTLTFSQNPDSVLFDQRNGVAQLHGIVGDCRQRHVVRGLDQLCQRLGLVERQPAERCHTDQSLGFGESGRSGNGQLFRQHQLQRQRLHSNGRRDAGGDHERRREYRECHGIAHVTDLFDTTREPARQLRRSACRALPARPRLTSLCQ